MNIDSFKNTWNYIDSEYNAWFIRRMDPTTEQQTLYVTLLMRDMLSIPRHDIDMIFKQVDKMFKNSGICNDPSYWTNYQLPVLMVLSAKYLTITK